MGFVVWLAQQVSDSSWWTASRGSTGSKWTAPRAGGQAEIPWTPQSGVTSVTPSGPDSSSEGFPGSLERTGCYAILVFLPASGWLLILWFSSEGLERGERESLPLPQFPPTIYPRDGNAVGEIAVGDDWLKPLGQILPGRLLVCVNVPD